MWKHVFSVLIYVGVSLVVQAVSHLVVFAHHYNEVGFVRAHPIFALGIGALVLQGILLSAVYSMTKSAGLGLSSAVGFTLLMGTFLISHEGMAEAAKYTVPDPAAWVGVEFASGFVQYLLIGLGIGLVHLKRQPNMAASAAEKVAGEAH